MRSRFTCRPSGVRCRSYVWSCSLCKIGWRTGRRSGCGARVESAIASLFGGGVSSLTASATSSAAVSAESERRAPASASSPQAAADFNALIAEAAKDLADYQRLTAEGKLGEAGQKLEELKRALDKLNTRQR